MTQTRHLFMVPLGPMDKKVGIKGSISSIPLDPSLSFVTLDSLSSSIFDCIARIISATQMLLRRTQHVKTKTENITFEHLDVPSTVRYMSSVPIFVSVHGAGMTNMFFMNPGSAVVEIIPYPLCECRSPDYFYGVGGYYHGSAIAQNIRHYPYCVDSTDTHWHKKSERMGKGHKCSWKYLHTVESVTLDATKFVSLMRSVERDLVQAGTVILTKPIINMSPHANG